MKKEVILAILSGFAIGLIITFGIYTAQKSLQNKQTGAEPTTSPQATTEPETQHTLTLISPGNETVHQQETITLEGKTSPQATVAIVTEEEEKIITADNQGQFATEITLKGGANTITATAFTSNGNQAKANLNLIYSTADF
jgi:hypothetical protein